MSSNLEFLFNDINQIISSSTMETGRATFSINKGGQFVYRGKRVSALEDIKLNEEFLIFLDSNSEKYCAVPINNAQAGGVLNERVLLSRHTVPTGNIPPNFNYLGLFTSSIDSSLYPDVIVAFNPEKPLIRLKTRESDSQYFENSCIWLNRNKLYALAIPNSSFSFSIGGVNLQTYIYFLNKNEKNWKKVNTGFPVFFDDFSALEFNNILIQLPYENSLTENIPWIIDYESGKFRQFPISGTVSSTGQTFNISFDFPTGLKSNDPEYSFQLSKSSTNPANPVCSGNYSFPMLINPQQRKHVLFSFDGTVSSEQEPVDDYNVYTKQRSGTSTEEMVFPDGTRRDIVSKSQWMVFINEEDFNPQTQTPEVGTVLTGSFGQNWKAFPPGYTGALPTPAQVMGMPANYSRYRSTDGTNFATEGAEVFPLISQTPAPGVIEELDALSSPGNAVFGVIYKNTVPFKTWIFKGTINSFSYSPVLVGRGADQTAFLADPAKYFVNVLNYSVTITEIVLEIDDENFNLRFNEQFYPGSFRFYNSSSPSLFNDKSGLFFLDGSFLNMFSSCYFIGPEGPSQCALGEWYRFFSNDFNKFRAGNRWIWRDPYVWRVTRDFVYNAYVSEDITNKGFFPRWKINYDTDPIRFEFDGIETPDLKLDIAPSGFTSFSPDTIDGTEGLCF